MSRALAIAASLVLAIGALPAPARAADGSAEPASAAAATTAATASAAPELLVMLHAPTAHARIDGVYGGAGYGDAARAEAQRRVGSRLASAHGLAVVSQWPMPSLGVDCIVMRLAPGSDLQASIAALQGHPEVAWAQALNQFQAQGHVDPLFALQPTARQWRLDDLHAITTGRGVRIALVDSGVDESHPDLAQAVETRRNFVDGPNRPAELHGTALAGLISARADNGIGIVGVAPGARLLALRACRELGSGQTLCDTLSLAKALDFAIARRAEIINMSLSGPVDELIARLIDVALSRQVQVVAAVDAQAAGGGFPASHAGVIAVSDALGVAGRTAPAGAWVAPARDLPTTVPGGGWRMVSGTSFAAGQLSGLLALMTQARSGGQAAALVRLPGGGIDACASLVRASSDAIRRGATGCLAPPGPNDGIAGR